MNPIDSLFHQHPRQEGMTYTQHLKRALWLSSKMTYGSICLIIHGLIPAFCEKSGSAVVASLYNDLNSKYTVKQE